MVYNQNLIVDKHVKGLSDHDRNIITMNYNPGTGQRNLPEYCPAKEVLNPNVSPYENPTAFKNAINSMKWLGLYQNSASRNKKSGELLPWTAMYDITITPTLIPPCDHLPVHPTSEKCWKCRTDKVFATKATNEVHPGSTWACEPGKKWLLGHVGSEPE